MKFKICITETDNETGRWRLFHREFSEEEICEMLAKQWDTDYDMEGNDKTCKAEIEGLEI